MIVCGVYIHAQNNNRLSFMWFFRRAVLRKWRSKYGRNATYRNLANCFYHADMSEMVEAICKVLGAPSGSVVGRQQGIYYIGILLIGIFLCTKGEMTWLPWILKFHGCYLH